MYFLLKSPPVCKVILTNFLSSNQAAEHDLEKYPVSGSGIGFKKYDHIQWF